MNQQTDRYTEHVKFFLKLKMVIKGGEYFLKINTFLLENNIYKYNILFHNCMLIESGVT